MTDRNFEFRIARVGRRLRAIAALIFTDQTIRLAVDPWIADLQAEYGAALRQARSWRARWVLVTGFFVSVKVLILCGYEDLFRTRHDIQNDAQALVRTAGFSFVAIVVMTILLMVPFLPVVQSPRAGHTRMLLLTIPQALVVAVPVGFTLGILYGLRGLVVSRRVAGMVLIAATVCSIVSFVLVSLIIPKTNQAFRQVLWSRVAITGPSSLPKGLNELTLGELREQIDSLSRAGRAFDARLLSVHYQGRWALPWATLALAVFSLSLISRHDVGRLALTVIACGACFFYEFLRFRAFELARDGALPAVLAMWLPNLVFALISGAVIRVVPAQRRCG